MSAPLPEKLPMDEEELEAEAVEEKPKKVAVVRKVVKKKQHTIDEDLEPEGAIFEKPKVATRKAPPRKATTKATKPANYIEYDV